MRGRWVIALTVSATAGAGAPAAQAGFTCSSSAGRLAILTQAVEPVTANSGTGPCAGDTKTLNGTAAGLPGPVSASALVAGTEVYPEKKSVLASGGVADFKVLSLPTLPIDLPPVAVPDAARTLIANALKADVDLTGVKALIPVLPTNLVTNLVTTLTTTLPTNLQTAIPDLPVSTLSDLVALVGGSLPALPTNLRTDLPVSMPPFVLDAADPALDTAAEVNAVNALVTAANSANTLANTANTLANNRNQTVNALGTIDIGEATVSTLSTLLAASSANAAAETANAAANAANQALNSAMAGLNAAHLATNAANAIINAANTAANTLRSSIPNTVAVDLSGNLDSLLSGLLPDGRLPTAELLSIKGAIAYAAASCQDGTPGVTGSSSVSGVRVLGQSVSVDQVVDRVLTLIDTAAIDPSQITIRAIDLGLGPAQQNLINGLPAVRNLLDTTVAAARTTIQRALDGLDAVKVLDPTVARVRVVPGAQTKSGNSITQQALTVAVSIAGQQLVSAIIGEAKASAAGVDCDDPVVDPSDPKGFEDDSGNPGTVKVPGIKGPVDPDTPEGATLQCSTRRLVLVDVLERGNRVKLYGVADPALAGKTVSIVFAATDRVVARTTIARDGSFDTTAPLPPASVRDTNAARYTAVLGKEESINLKLRRRMVITGTEVRGRDVTVTGRVLPPLGEPLQPITMTRRVSCTKDSVVKVFKPDADGRFRITVKAPRNLGTAVYRFTTEVRNSPTGRALFKTFTLPRAVNLQ